MAVRIQGKNIRLIKPKTDCEVQQNEKQKFKRIRLNPTHRWSEAETRDLLEAVVDQVKDNPESFEKPTAQRFYNKMAGKAPSLQDIHWVPMRGKLRYLKSRYIEAATWKGQTGAGLLANGEKKSVLEYIAKLCPYYDMLEQIFGQGKSVKQNVVIKRDADCISSDEEDGDVLVDPSLYEAIYETSNSTFGSQTQNDETFSTTIAKASTSALYENSANNSETSYEAFIKNVIAQKAKKKPCCNCSPISLLASIQEKKINFDKSKWELQLELETKQLELAKEKAKNEMELRKFELEQDLEIKKLELEKDERLAMTKMKLEVESQERLKKFELQLKSKTNQNDNF